jgi:hypothetical protein
MVMAMAMVMVMARAMVMAMATADNLPSGRSGHKKFIPDAGSGSVNGVE